MAASKGFEPLLERYQPQIGLARLFGRPLREEALNIRALLVGTFGFGNFVPGSYAPVLAKHSKHFSLEDSVAIGVYRMKRNFGCLKQRVTDDCGAPLGATADPLQQPTSRPHALALERPR